jgi:hypothetical protein
MITPSRPGCLLGGTGRWPLTVGDLPGRVRESLQRPATARWAPSGSVARISSISARRRAVASSTTSRPAAVTDTSTARRSARARCRRISPLRTSRSHIRPAVDGATSSAAARAAIRCGPREVSTTSARYCAIVVSSAAAPSDRVATATSDRLAVSTASTAPASGRHIRAVPCISCVLANLCIMQLYDTALFPGDLAEGAVADPPIDVVVPGERAGRIVRRTRCTSWSAVRGSPAARPVRPSAAAVLPPPSAVRTPQAATSYSERRTWAAVGLSPELSFLVCSSGR